MLMADTYLNQSHTYENCVFQFVYIYIYIYAWLDEGTVNMSIRQNIFTNTQSTFCLVFAGFSHVFVYPFTVLRSCNFTQ